MTKLSIESHVRAICELAGVRYEDTCEITIGVGVLRIRRVVRNESGSFFIVTDECSPYGLVGTLAAEARIKELEVALLLPAKPDPALSQQLEDYRMAADAEADRADEMQRERDAALARIEELEGERVSYQREMQEIVGQLQERLDERRVELESALASARDLRVELHWRVDQLDTAEARIEELDEEAQSWHREALDWQQAKLECDDVIEELSDENARLGEALRPLLECANQDAPMHTVTNCTFCSHHDVIEGRAALAALDGEAE